MNRINLNFLSFESRTHNPAVAPVLFGVFILAHLVVLFAFLRFAFPWTWEQQLSSGFTGILLTCLACNLVFCFGEFFFHRYLLHIDSVKWLGKLCYAHRAHHKLTSIQFDDRHSAVRSTYAIHDIDHDDSATFPPYALLLFFAFWTPFFAVIAFSFPQFPILIGGYIALAIAHFLYETLHVLHHMPYEQWWQRKVDGRIFGKVWHKMYGFHQAHHANYHCNMNIAGFFGLPLADLVLRTYKQPETLLLDGAPATKAAARALTPQPRWPVSSMDRAVIKRRARMKKEEDMRATRQGRLAK
ncbi:MAG: hypothetical protein Q7R30_10900 [Acidobacteriota bacterium]|nr:hypothetical protein [Acidobacteriota bacterium]